MNLRLKSATGHQRRWSMASTWRVLANAPAVRTVSCGGTPAMTAKITMTRLATAKPP